MEECIWATDLVSGYSNITLAQHADSLARPYQHLDSTNQTIRPVAADEPLTLESDAPIWHDAQEGVPIQDKWLPQQRQADPSETQRARPHQTTHTMSTTTTTTTTISGPSDNSRSKPRAISRSEPRNTSRNEPRNISRNEPTNNTRQGKVVADPNHTGHRSVSPDQQRQKLHKTPPRKSSVQRKPLRNTPSPQATLQSYGQPRSSQDYLRNDIPASEHTRSRHSSQPEAHIATRGYQTDPSFTAVGRHSQQNAYISPTRYQAREEMPLYHDGYTHDPSESRDLQSQTPHSNIASPSSRTQGFPLPPQNGTGHGPRDSHHQNNIGSSFQSDSNSLPSQRYPPNDSRGHSRKTSVDKPLPRSPEAEASHKPSKTSQIPRSIMKGSRESEAYQNQAEHWEPNLPNLRNESNRRSDIQPLSAQNVVDRAKSNTVDTEVIERVAPGKPCLSKPTPTYLSPIR